MIIGVHAGHNPDGRVACGAIGLIRESTEARKVKDEVIRLLKSVGHKVYDCTVDNGTSQSDIINKQVKKSNAQPLDLTVSIHFNSGANDKNGNGKSTGVEVLMTSIDGVKKEVGTRICNNVAKLGFKNRGNKQRNNLGFLNNSKAKAIIVECCFVDDKDDVNLYDYKTMAKAIAEGIHGSSINGSVSQTKPSSTTPSNDFKIGEYDKDVIVTAEPTLTHRESRNPSSKKLASIPKGTVLNIWAIDKGTDGNLWGSCRYNGVIGYVCMKYTVKK